MSKENEQLIADLEKQIGDLAAKIEKYEEGGDAVSKELQDQIATLKSALETAEGALTVAKEDAEAKDAELAVAKARADMSDECRKHYDGLTDEALKKSFLEMTPEQRVSKLADIKKGDEVIKIEGVEIRKSEVGDAQFAVLKGQNERITKAEELAKAEREKREVAEFNKRATDEFPHLAGTDVEKGAVLKAVSTLSKEVQETLDKIFKAAEATSKLAFEKLGHNAGDAKIEKGAADFEKRIQEVAKAYPKLSRTEVLQKAQTDYPKEFEAYQAAN